MIDLEIVQNAFNHMVANAINAAPRLLTALVILLAGWLLAQFLAKTAQAAMKRMGVEFHQEVGQAVNVLLLIMVVIVVLEQLGINASVVSRIFTNVITLVVAGLALAFGLGGRDVARSVLAGYYAREQFVPGGRVVIGGEEGVLEAIGPLNTEIRLGSERLLVPNTTLTETAVKIKDTHLDQPFLELDE